VQFQVRDYQAVIGDFDTRTRSELRAAVAELGALRNHAASAPAPDCARDAQRIAIESMTTAAGALQAYANGQRDDTEAVRQEAQTAINEAQAVLDPLFERLEAQYQQGR
jgi:hypothetical protein